MFRWLKEFRMGSALMESTELPRDPKARVDSSSEFGHYPHASSLLDRRLRAEVPRTEPPEELHSSVMRAVRSARRQPSTLQGLRLALSAAAAVVLLVGGTWFWLRPSPPPAQAALLPEPGLAAAGQALTLATGLPRTAPTAAIKPLAQELDCLTQDLQSAANLLVASLPY